MKKTNDYEPELGQAIFGQPHQRYEGSSMLEAALLLIREELDRIMWNIHQEEYDSPFANTGESFSCEEFTVEAYSWDDSKEQPYNFKWNDIEISWYKHYRRGLSVNTQLTNDHIADMLEACINALQAYEKKKLPDIYR
jgi:hypothetical protein